MFIERADDYNNLTCGFVKDVCEIGDTGSGVRDFVGDHAACGGVDEIEHVVNAAAERLDIFAIKWRDESLVEAREKSVREIVAGVFNILDALGIFVEAVVLLEHFHEHLRALMAIVGESDKHLKKIIFARH